MEATQPTVNAGSLQPPPSPPQSGDLFATTRWTVVLAAGTGTAPDADRALDELCRAYWYPLYAYVRRQGRSREDAEDLVQGFFATFLAKNYLEGLSGERGRFRAFLLACLKHFLANEHDRIHRKKRGGQALHLSLDWQSADTCYQLEPSHDASPDRAYDRAWAVALLDRVLGRLEGECAAEDQSGRIQFQRAKDFLVLGPEAIPYAAAAQGAGMTEGALRVAVHRLRRRYRQLLREEIAQTLAAAQPTQVEEEMRSLFAAFTSAP